MNPETSDLWSRIITNPDAKGILRLAMRHVAHDLSELCGRSIKMKGLQLETLFPEELPRTTDTPEAEMVGVYLFTGDNLPGHALLILSLNDALYLADWLLELRPGTTSRLGSLEYSALAEVGNQMLSAFLNVLAEFAGTPLHPSTPAVTVDILVNILEVIATSVAAAADEFLMIKTNFKDSYDSVEIQFWVWPDPHGVRNEIRPG